MTIQEQQSARAGAGEAASLLDQRRLLTAKEVAEYLNLPLQTVWKYSRQGMIGGVVRVGRQIRFDPQRMREWVADGGHSLEEPK